MSFQSLEGVREDYCAVQLEPGFVLLCGITDLSMPQFRSAHVLRNIFCAHLSLHAQFCYLLSSACSEVVGVLASQADFRQR